MEIREQLELMKRAKTCPDYKKVSKDRLLHHFSVCVFNLHIVIDLLLIH